MKSYTVSMESYSSIEEITMVVLTSNKDISREGGLLSPFAGHGSKKATQQQPRQWTWWAVWSHEKRGRAGTTVVGSRRKEWSSVATAKEECTASLGLEEAIRRFLSKEKPSADFHM